jgi:hypothetical protein
MRNGAQLPKKAHSRDRAADSDKHSKYLSHTRFASSCAALRAPCCVAHLDMRGALQAAPAGAPPDVANAALRDGHLLVVRSLLRVLPCARAAKAAADAAVDACGAMQNLRTAIAWYRGTLMGEPREGKRARVLSVCTVRTSLSQTLLTSHRASHVPET